MIPLHKILIKKADIEGHFPENHLIWKLFRYGNEESTVRASSDYTLMNGNYNEFYIVSTPDGMKFTVGKEFVKVIF